MGKVTLRRQGYGLFAAKIWFRSHELFKKLKPLEITECPFANLPEKHAGRWGAGLTAAKMEECRWLKPVLVAQVEFVEWTSDAHLRHSRFVALREDKRAKDVRRE
jgi:bifunctional non-homologous end joining protein LigD